MMGISRRTLFWAVLVLIIIIIAFSIVSYASGDAPCDFRSFTKAVKSCDRYGNCILQDFFVECCGSQISKIVPIGNFISVSADHNENDFEWCE